MMLKVMRSVKHILRQPVTQHMMRSGMGGSGMGGSGMGGYGMDGEFDIDGSEPIFRYFCMSVFFMLFSFLISTQGTTACT